MPSSGTTAGSPIGTGANGDSKEQQGSGSGGGGSGSLRADGGDQSEIVPSPTVSEANASNGADRTGTATRGMSKTSSSKPPPGSPNEGIGSAEPEPVECVQTAEEDIASTTNNTPLSPEKGSLAVDVAIGRTASDDCESKQPEPPPEFVPVDTAAAGEEEEEEARRRENHQWVIDRCNGESKIGDYHPPCRLCWAPPCIKCCPTILEQNCICEFVGRVGIDCPKGTMWRRLLMGVGLVTSVIGAALTIVSCFAISTNNYDFIRNTAFTAGNVHHTAITATGVTKELLVDSHIDIGLAAVAYDNPRTVGRTVITFEALCNLEPDLVVIPLKDIYGDTIPYTNGQEQCFACAQISRGLVSTTIISLLSYVPTISTCVLRMHENYDVNCQKTFGVGVTLFSFLMSMYTWIGYRNACFRALFDGALVFDANYVPVQSGDETAALLVDFGWGPGVGYICIIVATLLKIVVVICHLLLRTPDITRDHQEQADYEKL